MKRKNKFIKPSEDNRWDATFLTLSAKENSLLKQTTIVEHIRRKRKKN